MIFEERQIEKNNFFFKSDIAFWSDNLKSDCGSHSSF